jgi:tRNA G10  N-methylase Trm11
MSKYIFILGQASDLSRAEIFSLYKNITNISQNIIMLEAKLDPKTTLKKLGGTIKIAQYLKTINSLDELTATWWSEQLNLSEAKAKINFGFSLYNDHQKNYQKITKIALATKKNLKTKNLSCRLVVGREATLSSVIVAKNKLIDRELLIIKDNGKYILAQTQAVQDFEDYSQRDINRPIRDDRSGMLPIKVAQMMLNLAGPKITQNILDPFCGSGTILQEAALAGYPTIYGSDVSANTIHSAQENINWLQKQLNKSSKIILKTTSVENLSKHFQSQSIDLIVSEPFMGEARAIKQNHNADTIYDIAENLSQLYIKAFQQFKIILKPGAKVIFIFPIFKIGKEYIYTLPQAQIKKMGFNPIFSATTLNYASRNGNIIYARPEQIVQREIAIYSIQAN